MDVLKSLKNVIWFKSMRLDITFNDFMLLLLCVALCIAAIKVFYHIVKDGL
jgi:hypothetical protein